MRITLPSGTEAEVVKHPNPKMGLVIAPDIFGLRPLFDNMVQTLSDAWQMSVIAVEPFPGRGFGPEIEPRMAAIPELKDTDAIGDLHAAADLLGTPVTGLLGFCMGGMYCFKAARDERFARIATLLMATQTMCLQFWVVTIRIRPKPTLLSCALPGHRLCSTQTQNTDLHTMHHAPLTEKTMQQMHLHAHRRGC